MNEENEIYTAWERLSKTPIKIELSEAEKKRLSDINEAHKRAQEKKWCLCPNFGNCEYLERDEYCR